MILFDLNSILKISKLFQIVAYIKILTILVPIPNMLELFKVDLLPNNLFLVIQVLSLVSYH